MIRQAVVFVVVVVVFAVFFADALFHIHLWKLSSMNIHLYCPHLQETNFAALLLLWHWLRRLFQEMNTPTLTPYKNNKN